MAFLLAALTCTIGMEKPAYAAGDSGDTINKGVFLGDIDAGGMTKQEAQDAIDDYIAGLDKEEITSGSMRKK